MMTHLWSSSSADNLYPSRVLISISFGSTRLKNTETTNTTATTLAENTDWNNSGKISQI